MSMVGRLVVVVCLAASLSGCGLVKRKAVNMVASTLASSGDVFTRDDDLELVGQAIPFGLKLYESLLDSTPKNKDLLIATCSNFTQYGVAYLETEAAVLGEWVDTRLAGPRFRQAPLQVIVEAERLANGFVGQLELLARGEGEMRCPIKIRFGQCRRRKAKGETRGGRVERAVYDVG